MTLVADDMLNCARAMFLKEESVKDSEPEVLMEITMKNLLASGELDLRDFLDRVDMLGAMGRTVLISNYGAYYRLVAYLTLHRPADRPSFGHPGDGGDSGGSAIRRPRKAAFLRPLGDFFKTG